MTSRDFVYWMQGYLELEDMAGQKRADSSLTHQQVECIKRHLAMVFKHEIDPSMGDPEHQATLNETHAPPKPNAHLAWPSGVAPGGPTMRC